MFDLSVEDLAFDLVALRVRLRRAIANKLVAHGIVVIGIDTAKALLIRLESDQASRQTREADRAA